MASRGIIFILGWLITFIGMAELAMVGMAFALGEGGYAAVFFESGLLTTFIGGGLVIALRNTGVDPDRREGLPLLFLALFFGGVFAALPLTSAGDGMTIGQAWFESLSMLTTTGLSMLPPPEEQARSILMWRAILAWLGGLWFMVVGVVMLAGLSIGGLQPGQAPVAHGEGETLMRRLRLTARLVLPLYGGVTFLGMMVLVLVGLHPFDAFVHALSAVSTSGISSINGSVPGFGVVPVEVVLTGLSLFGAINITLLLRATTTRLEVFKADMEWWIVGVIGLVVGGILFAESFYGGAPASWRAVWDGVFTGISFATTTGFGSALGMGPLGTFALIGTLVVGGSVASTAGGIHPSRLALLLKHGQTEMTRLIYPHGISSQQLGAARVPAEVMRAAVAFLAVYLATLAALSIGMAAGGLDLANAVIAAVSAMSSTGPALPMLSDGNLTGADLSSFGKLVYAIGMVAGRLDVLALLVIVLPSFWRR